MFFGEGMRTTEGPGEQSPGYRHGKSELTRMPMDDPYEASIMNIDSLANPDAFVALLDWKLRSPRQLRKQKLTAITRGEHMQRQFTVELRVDYADNDKNDVMRAALQHAARHVYATAVLLADGIKPQVAVFSDDFFSGHEEIKLLDDVIQQGLDETGETGSDEISSELMAAARDSNADANKA